MLASALRIIKRLHKKGYTAYIAGGAVRDMLLSKKPKDYDVATNATPDEIEKIIPHTIPVGRSFGVLLVKSGKHFIEVATFRKDKDYIDGRRPSTVEFTDAKEDAIRRDFTINGMFFDPIEKKIIDFVDGQKDLEKGIIRFIGDPEKRIQEDYLRLLRAVRLKHSTNFTYEQTTYKAIQKYAHLVEKVSKERVYEEFVRMFSLPNPHEIILDLDQSGLLQYLIPELLITKKTTQSPEIHAEGSVWNHLLLALESIPEKSNYLVRLAVLFHDIAKPQTQHLHIKGGMDFHGHSLIGMEMAKKILERLGFSKKERDIVGNCIKYHLMYEQILQMPERRRNSWFQKDFFPYLLEVMRADSLATLPAEIESWKQIHKMYVQWKKKKEAHITPLLSGKDIMERFSLPPGERIGELLHIAQEAYLDGKIHNKEEALEYLNHIITLTKCDNGVF